MPSPTLASPAWFLPGDQASFAEIAANAGLGEQVTRRLLQHAMTMNVLCEPQPGTVAHTKTSRALVNPGMNDWLRIGTRDMWPAAVKIIKVLQKWEESPEPNETGFSLGNNTTDSLYTVMSGNPERAALFANAMKVWAGSPEYHPRYIVELYDWGSVGEAQVIDLGGARGHIGIALAQHFGNLSVIVQDMEQVVEKAEVPEHLSGRVRFVAHDFFTPQTVKANVPFLSWILHNWSDKYCIMILKAIIPAMKPGARLIIQDICMPEPGAIAQWREKDLRAVDLKMGAIHNAAENGGRVVVTLVRGRSKI